MARNAERNIVIRRKKVIAGGHHGGAWKVAYADFVTAMMAFFLLMWLLSTTSEEQREGLADYFSPDIPIFASRSGGDGPFEGTSLFAQEDLLDAASGAAADDASLAEVQAALNGNSGDAMLANPLLEHIRTRVTDEGLIIEVFDLENSRLFQADTARPTPVLEDLIAMIGRVLAATANEIAVTGHVGLETLDAWTLSADRAQTTRRLLVGNGVGEARLARVTGKADREPATGTAADPRNRRVEITLLRRFKT